MKYHRKQSLDWFVDWFLKKQGWKKVVLIAVAAFLVICGLMAIWIATLQIPDLGSFQNHVLAGSTKIYDRTGETLLYDLNRDAKQQVVPFDQISPYLKDATIAIEDQDFYKHKGIAFTSIIRAALVDITSFKLKEGGSTITQQVVKNTLLTTDKKISRKIKEWVLALKLDRVMSKDDILNMYLNSSPYGGPYYGVEEASQNYFGKKASDINLVEAAYIAALPQSPTYYSPFGKHLDALELRKNLVLQKMKENGFITEAQYNDSVKQKVTFQKQETHSIKAPHFVMFIQDYLIEKYGEDLVRNGGLKVTTTLDYTMQQKAEEIVKKYALANVEKFTATNAALVAIDPNNGQILTMVGSRDYFDKKIDGQFNVATAYRQPGSTFKPFAYVTAFEKGFTPDTVLFDVPTQFSTTCDANGTPLSAGASCYMPQNYDDRFRGPMSLRNALAQSINIPSIKTLYLAGLKDTLQTAKDMGITSLTDVSRYGLTLVLGGGEVSPLDMTSAYGVFATNGVRSPYTGILSVQDRDGKELEKFELTQQQVLEPEAVEQLNDVLADNNARLPLNGAGSATDFPNRQVALKTGTTNDSRDAWIVGYTPNIVVGTWAGNNDNSPMIHKTSGLIVAPMWRAFMDAILPNVPVSSFIPPTPIDPNLKPILRGIWQGNQTYIVDKTTNNLATDFTPADNRQEMAIPNVHSILYWVDKSDPAGPVPNNPSKDPQFALWEPPVLAWAAANGQTLGPSMPPTQTSPIPQTPTNTSALLLTITGPTPGSVFAPANTINVFYSYQSRYKIVRAELYVNNNLIETSKSLTNSFMFVPQNIPSTKTTNTNDVKVIIYDEFNNKTEAHTNFRLNQH
jgi:1A family penicillin-binding protein